MPELVKLKHDTVSRRVIVMPVWKEEETEESPEKDVAKKAENRNVVAKMEFILARLRNVELTIEEEASLVKMCFHLVKILQSKDRTSSSNGTNGSRAFRNPSQYRSHIQNVESVSRLSLLSVNDWTKTSGIPSLGPKGIDHGIGVSYLKTSNRWVVSCMGDKKLKMFSADGRFLTLVTCVEAEDGDLKEPSAIVSLEDGGFAVSDKSRVLVFNEDGRFIKTAWRTKDLMMCFGLGQDHKRRLVLLLENNRGQTLVSLLDSQSNLINCYDVREIVNLNRASPQDQEKSKFRFLSVFGNSVIVIDTGLNTVYVLKFSLGGHLMKDIEIFGGFLKNPAGASSDHEGNILVADYENKKLCIFSEEGRWIRTIMVNVRSL